MPSVQLFLLNGKREEGTLSQPGAVDRKLAKRLVLDELFDLSLYQSLREVATGALRSILDRLIPIEARHLAFWQDFFDLHVERLAITNVFAAPASKARYACGAWSREMTSTLTARAI